MANVFSSPKYLFVESRRMGGVPFEVSSPDGRSIGLIKRRIPESNLFDAISVYGYSEIDRSNPGMNIKRDDYFLDLVCQRARESGIITAFVRLSPGQQIELPEETVGAVHTIGPVVEVDLRRPWEEIFQSFRSRLRGQLRAMNSLTFETDGSPEVFFRIYTENMWRLAAQEQYFFSSDYISKLLKIDGVRLLLASDARGPISGAITFEHNDKIYYHLGATSDRGAPLSPLKAVLAELTRMHAGGPYKALVLGGGLGGENDTLLRFKRGFSKKMLTASMLKLVFDTDAYATLVGCRPEEIDFAGYFPSYRSPGN